MVSKMELVTELTNSDDGESVEADAVTVSITGVASPELVNGTIEEEFESIIVIVEVVVDVSIEEEFESMIVVVVVVE